MRIILSSKPRDRGGDLMGLAILLNLLEDYSKTKSLDLYHRAVLDSWIEALTDIANKVLRANMDGTNLPQEYELPLEELFSSKIKV